MEKKNLIELVAKMLISGKRPELKDQQLKREKKNSRTAYVINECVNTRAVFAKIIKLKFSIWTKGNKLMFIEYNGPHVIVIKSVP